MINGWDLRDGMMTLKCNFFFGVDHTAIINSQRQRDTQLSIIHQLSLVQGKRGEAQRMETERDSREGMDSSRRGNQWHGDTFVRLYDPLFSILRTCSVSKRLLYCLANTNSHSHSQLMTSSLQFFCILFSLCFYCWLFLFLSS